MTDTNATTLRNALAAAIKNHVTSNGLKAKDAAEAAGVQYSRLSQILRGDVAKISSDALVNVLGGFGYRLTGITGSGNGTEIVLSVDKAEGQVLPEIEPPSASYTLNVVEDESGAFKADGMKIVAADGSWEASKDGPFRVVDGQVEIDPDADRVVSDDE